jgi:predicted metal-binding membrane protein
MDMPMPGGWTMSMMWMRVPGQSWPGTVAVFMGMWIVMMAAMMLPSIVPMLWRYRQSLAATRAMHVNGLIAVAGTGYFAVWTLVGLATFPAGVAVATVAMCYPALSEAVPAAAGIVVLIAGLLQLTKWKARQLECCREISGPGGGRPAGAGTAWRHGVRLGLHCVRCCANLMAILLAVGVMDAGAMAAVTAAITIERLAPDGARVARVSGIVAGAAGVLLIASSIAYP